MSIAAMLSPLHLLDSVRVADGSGAVLKCLQEGMYAGCPGVFYFPLLQYIPAVLLRLMHFGRESILLAFVALNLLSAAGVIALFSMGFKDRERKFWVATIVLVTGPMLFYLRTSLGEPFAAFLLTALCFFSRRGGRWGTPLFSFLSAISKEVAFPFVILLTLAATSKLKPEARRPILIRACIAAFLGHALGHAFNFFRFSSFVNTWYSQPALRAPGLEAFLDHLLALAFSPNGGLFVFWPALCAVFVRCYLNPDTRSGRRALRLGALVFSVIYFGLAAWSTPFGWAAWGPRLLLPWLPPLLFLALEFSEGWEIRRKSLLPAYQFALIVSIPHVLVFFDATPFQRLDAGTSSVCPKLVSVLEDPRGYHACMDALMWPRATPIWTDLYTSLLQPEPMAMAIAYALALGAMFLLLRKTL